MSLTAVCCGILSHVPADKDNPLWTNFHTNLTIKYAFKEIVLHQGLVNPDDGVAAREIYSGDVDSFSRSGVVILSGCELIRCRVAEVSRSMSRFH